MSNPFENGGGGSDAILRAQGEELREVLNMSAGAEIESLIARLDVALDTLHGRELAAELDEIGQDLEETPDLLDK